MSEEKRSSTPDLLVEKVLLQSELDAEQEGRASSGEATWVQRREAVVRQALDDGDHGALGKIAALPGGFGTEKLRKEAWLVLLRTRSFFPGTSGSADEATSTPNGIVEHDDGTTDSKRRDQPASGSTIEPAPHADENQVLLDTKRSFVVYPKDLHPQSKLAMQGDLHALIVHVLRLHPTLSYFQGFHDIMSVLYLAFIPLPSPPAARSRSTSIRSRDRSGASTPAPLEAINEKTKSASSDPDPSSQGKKDSAAVQPLPEVENEAKDDVQGKTLAASQVERTARDRDTLAWTSLRQCAEVVSTCRVRDAMGRGMEPMMGLLKLLQRLLKAADPELSAFSASISPVPTLPFFALSWILCLFSHDIDTLEPVQRMFDFLLSRNPVSAIYLAVAILIAKKDQMFRLAKQMGEDAEDDPSLLHPLFARLPPLFADTPDQPVASESDENVNPASHDEPNPYTPIPISRIFAITDELMARLPWDGSMMRGEEVFGSGSAIRTYEREPLVEQDEWSLAAAEAMVDVDVVMPGGTEPDEEEEDELPPQTTRKVTRRRMNRSGVALAAGVALLGVGIAVYGFKANGSRPGWVGWWTTVWKSWAGKNGLEESFGAWRRVLRYAGRSLKEVL